MLVLGIESSCDETAAAVVDGDGRVLSDVVRSQIALHAPYGGVVPELASRDHLHNLGPVVRAAVERAGVGLRELDAVAVTNRPGLVGALLVGVQAAKGIAWAAGKPLIGVDHLMGHVLSVFLRREDGTAETPRFPFVCLLASGGHTAIYRVGKPHADAIEELGATRDDAVGEAFDKVARLLGLGYPGGPVIDRLAQDGNPSRIKLSTPMASCRTLEMSFSGIKTQISQLVAREGRSSDATWVADVCAAFQATIVEVLARKVVAGARREHVADIVLGGGAVANRALRRRTTDLAGEHGLRVFIPPIANCGDNAAMIAYAGALRLAAHETDGWDLVATGRTVLPRATRKGRGAR
jgi:N6-L-threonylcarbamoyladenine synthase